MSNALIIIDMQEFVNDRISNGVDAYPADAIANMRAVLDTFRRSGHPVIHVRHHTPGEGSPLHATSPLAHVVEGFEEINGEPVLIKHTSSAFASTDLAACLSERAIDECVVIGAVAGFCVNSTVRAGADSGFNMTVVKDAVLSFGLEGATHDAKNIHDVTIALLQAGFAKITETKAFL